ncbi:TonB-dependent receptor [Brevundimonas sp. SH203]|uniref:TonB-dependent receptor n=1 Tax=Brevundimonas sp. SH203 TaxID=345167 RepID=UPI0013566826|nr:TonB-dependent receptor [Brevundimonas sp. SH203]
MRPAEAGRPEPLDLSRSRAAALNVSFALVATAALATPAWAAQPHVLDLYVPRQPVDHALLDLALEARVSLGGSVTACTGTSPVLRGRMTLDAALDRILAGSGCRYLIRPDGAVIISPAPRVSPMPPSTPSRTTSRPAPSTEAVQVSEVVVTAPRRPELIQRSSSAMTAVTGDRIGRAGVTGMQGLDNLVSGMTVTNLGPGRNKILLRGISDGVFTGLTQSTVGLYLDLTPITYSAPDPDLKLIDVDRVEVLRGPQGTLYGTGPIGGVVRIVTRRPEFGREDLAVALTRSNTHGGGTNTDYNVVANLPLAGERAAIRAAVYGESFSGYINNVELNLRRVNDGTRRGGRLSGALALAPGWTARAGLVHQSIMTEDTHYIYRGSGPLRRANLVREPHQNRFDQASLSLEGRGDWGRLDASLAVVEHRFKSRYDASSALRRFGSSASVGALDENKDIDLVVGEAVLTSPDVGRWRWLVGALASTSTTRTNPVLSILRAEPLRLYAETRRDTLKEAAVYGETAWNLTPTLTLTAGARYYTLDYDTTSTVRQRTRVRNFDGQGSSSGLTPKIALAWQPSDRLNLSAQLSHGRRAGGFNTAGVIGQDFSGLADSPARQYRPDSLWNLELNAKVRSADGRARVRAAVYAARWRDVQSDQFLPSGLAYVVNVGDGADVGFEAEANWRPTDGLEIFANGLIADPRITDPASRFETQRGAALPGVPKASANLGFTYRRPLGDRLQLIADGGVSYVGASRLTFDGRQQHRMGDYATGRLSMGVEAAPWVATVFVDNLFDTRANTFAYSDPFRLPDAKAVTPLRPRTIGLTLRWALQ